MLAVVFALEKFRSYLLDNTFTLITDSNSLKEILNQPKTSRKIERWRLLVMEYIFKVEHRKGTLNTNADALSRLPQMEEYELLPYQPMSNYTAYPRPNPPQSNMV